MYRIFKNTVIVLGLIAGIGMLSCEQEVEKPKAKFYIETIDSVSGTFVVLKEPYTISVNQRLYIYADNEAEFNTFWPGDTVYGEENNDTIYHNYTDDLSHLHQGIAIEGDEGRKDYTYKSPGVYTFTFISVNTGDEGETLKKDTKVTTITVQ
jgi:hypothetical protein